MNEQNLKRSFCNPSLNPIKVGVQQSAKTITATNKPTSAEDPMTCLLAPPVKVAAVGFVAVGATVGATVGAVVGAVVGTTTTVLELTKVLELATLELDTAIWAAAAW